MNIAVVGTGYVGLVTAACIAEMGNEVFCIDINPQIVESLRRGAIPIHEPGLEPLVKRNTEQGRLLFTTDLAEGLQNALFVFNCVGTPSLPDGSCDLRFVDQVARQIGEVLDEYKIVVNKSTVPVGTGERMRGLIQAELDRRGVAVEFDVVSNPEFLKEGDAVNDFMKPDRVIVGTDNVRTAKLLETLYAPFARSRDKLMVMGVKSAELTKYAANCLLAAKISFINEIANICEQVGADVKDVRRGIGSDHRIGYSFIYPGVGYGGSCFPKDVKALIATARDSGYEPELITAIDRVNVRQKKLLGRKMLGFFAGQGGAEGKTVALWGLAFKANTDDIRESPALDVIADLTAAGVRVRAYDPIANGNARRQLGEAPGLVIAEEQYEALEGADALAVVTDWNQFRNPDFGRIKKSLKTPVIFDGRNLYSAAFVTAQGFVYFGIGRPRAAEEKCSWCR
jgi:UDPglucose 6-dehydrogenase